MEFEISIPVYEGPFDLLLFFIERDELDIHDIPISKITADFLSYIQTLEELKINVASEFIVMAATLMQIKAKYLLPRKELNELGEEIDPRQDLVARLIEYKRYKEATTDLANLEALRQKLTTRGNLDKERKQLAQIALLDIELQNLTLSALLKAFQRVLERKAIQEKSASHKIHKIAYTIKEEKNYVKNLLRKGRVGFNHIFDGVKYRMHAIVRFLSLLELINDRELNITEGETINTFWIEPQTKETVD